jgi:uncharacterized protein (DUF305 family)
MESMGALALILLLGAAARDPGFASLMEEATTRMHAGMQVQLSGNPDRDFARMMIPHHQGAIDMALVELRYGKDERLRRLAQEIIVEQQQEIAVMQQALRKQQ